MHLVIHFDSYKQYKFSLKMPPEKIQSDDNQSGLTAVNSDNKSKSNAKVPGFEDNSSEATKSL
jgi:hypothetical protein